jgi:hypothetical protein
MQSVTIDEIMAWEPCPEYPRERVAELFGKNSAVTWRQMARWRIPHEDRVWGLLHNEFLTDAQLWELACQFAERALLAERKAGREPAEASWNAIATRRRWLRGEATDEEIASAASAASAARAAYCAASADRAAYCAAGAAYFAAYWVSRAAEARVQLRLICKMLRGE